LRIDRISLVDTGQNSRLDVETGPVDTMAAEDDLRAAVSRLIDLLQQKVKRALRRYRAQRCRGIIRRSSPE
jgi:hypothetical protein